MQPSCCPANVPFTIFTGDQKTIPLRIAYNTGLPVDLSSCTEIVVNLPKADGSFLQLKLSLAQVSIVSPAILGQFTAIVTTVQSATLNIGEAQDIDVTFTISGSPLTVRFYGAISVYEAA
jgi:hypothetical protein